MNVWKTARDGLRRIASGRLFQARGAATAKALSPTVERRVAGTMMIMAVSSMPRGAAIATPPWFVDKVDNSLTDLGRARSSTSAQAFRAQASYADHESSSCHVSQRHSTSIDWSRFIAMMSSIFPAAERTFMQPNTSCCVIGDVCRGEVRTPMSSTGSVAHVCLRGAVGDVARRRRCRTSISAH